MTLTEFLLARIAEDQRTAEVTEMTVEGIYWPNGGIGQIQRDCQAKRRIVELHTGDHECVGIKYGKQDTVYVHPDFVFRNDPTLCLLAATYLDHPDYREEWKP